MFAHIGRSGGANGYVRNGLDIYVPMEEVIALPDDDAVLIAEREIRRKWLSRLPVGLLIAAAWDAFHPSARTRSRRVERNKKDEAKGGLSPAEKKAVDQIAEGYRIPKEQARQLVLQAVEKDEPWIKEFLVKDADERTRFKHTSGALPCPSKFFRISARMVSYWRRFKRDDYANEMIWFVVRDLPQKLQPRKRRVTA